MIRLPNLQPSNPNPSTISAEAIAAPSRALQDISTGLAYTGEALNSQALRIQGIENARLESETRQQWNRRTAELDNKLKTTSDPTAYNTLTQTLLEELKSDLDNTELPPVVANRLQLQFSDFSTRATISAAERSSNLAISRAQKAFQNELETATYTGDRNALENALETARDGFGLPPEDEEAIIRNFDQNAEFQSVKLQAEDAPDNALQDLESEDFQALYPNLTPDDRDQLKRLANQQKELKRSEEIQLLEDALYSQKLKPADLEAAQYLTPKDRAAFAASIEAAKTEKPITQQEYLSAWKLADNLRQARTDPRISEDQYRILHNETRSKILGNIPPSLQGDLKKELGYLSPAGRNTSTPATDQSDLEAEARAQINRALDAGLYGDTSKEASFASKEAAARKAEDLRRQTKAYIQKHNPDPQQLRQFIDELNGTAISDEDIIVLPEIPNNFSIEDTSIDNLIQPLPDMLPGTGQTQQILPPKQ